jgi:hypothetical protein
MSFYKIDRSKNLSQQCTDVTRYIYRLDPQLSYKGVDENLYQRAPVTV